jgi:hypothetical protein
MVAVARRCTLLVNGPIVGYRNGPARYVYIPTTGTASHYPDPPRLPISPRWLQRSTFAMETGRSGRIGASQAIGAGGRRAPSRDRAAEEGGGAASRDQVAAVQAVRGAPTTVAAATDDGEATTPPRSCAMHAGDSRLLHQRDPQPRRPLVATTATLPRQSPVHTLPVHPPRRPTGRIAKRHHRVRGKEVIVGCERTCHEVR